MTTEDGDVIGCVDAHKHTHYIDGAYRKSPAVLAEIPHL